MADTDKCDHPPIPCALDSTTRACRVRLWSKAWASVDRSDVRSPLTTELMEASGDEARVNLAGVLEGYGMTSAPAVVRAYATLRQNTTAVVSSGIQVCSQCRPGTNTYTFAGSRYEGRCTRIAVDLDGRPPDHKGDAVLCIGREGRLCYRRAGDFIAVSHVWAHGWQGVTEDGICSRVLELLLNAASRFGVEWIWLDIAMVSGVREVRAVAVNAMNRVYTTAAGTIVCDRLLLSMKGGTDRERVVAMASSDWMTRLWTMQEAILSRKLIFLQQDGYWLAEEILDSLINHCDQGPEHHWKQYHSILTLWGMVKNSESPLERIASFSRGRKTTKRVDLTRALFPLFKLEWPSADTTLEEGQIILLKHLGNEASRCAFLYGPVGLPPPWTWAPLSLPGCSGILMRHEDLPIDQVEQGLNGTWFVVTVRLEKGGRKHSKDAAEYSNDGALYPEFQAGITGTFYDFMIFTTEDGINIFSAVFHNEKDFETWGSKTLLLLRPPTVELPPYGDWGFYNLAIVDEVTGNDEYSMRRVGSVMGNITMAEFKQLEKRIQGVLT